MGVEKRYVGSFSFYHVGCRRMKKEDGDSEYFQNNYSTLWLGFLYFDAILGSNLDDYVYN